MKSLSPSDYAAWWGAFTASIVGFWEVYKWWCNRPGFIAKAHCPSKLDLENKCKVLSVAIEVINRQSPLSIKSVSLRHYKNIWHRAFFKPDRTCKLTRSDLPKKLDPADVYNIILTD
jgi:hypothetical protein